LNLQGDGLFPQRLIDYSQILIDSGKKTNLTGAKSIEEFIEKPLFDALTLLTLYKPVEDILDIGSGGGLPAIPLLLLYPDIKLTMVEPRKKRVEFLTFCIKKLNLTAEIIQTQDRELNIPLAASVVSQAVFEPLIWIKRAKRLVKDNGLIYVLSSTSIESEKISKGIKIESSKKIIRPIDNSLRYVNCIKKQ
ncbi:MAG: 16S rRNA (guanine(527)-N(7))-methyltransferase RsmG, partial [Deltaproteobacteria bacterium]|nr:16S rRNA (guanine(527)-N(7))-methyltransferase RsmG [Deltaproteobacteria bacterium]